MLLVLDNFEHLLDGACLVLEILNNAPDVKILATSRARLMVTGEHIFELWGMAYPESPTPRMRSRSSLARLSCSKTQASRMQGGVQTQRRSSGEMIRICALLEGMPLGIILAASWVPMLTPSWRSQQRSTADLDFLEKELRDLPRRQRGMRSVFNHSWRLL